MTGIELVLLSCGCAGASGLPGLAFSRDSNNGQRLSAALSVLASAVGLIGVAVTFAHGQSTLALDVWFVPDARFLVGLDALSALFLIPVYIVSAVGALYGLDYWPQSERRGNGRALRFFYGLVTAAMAGLLVARNGVLFLVFWEVMAVAAFFLVGTEHEKPEVRSASWVYLVSTHAGTAALILQFLWMGERSGSFNWTNLDGLSGSDGVLLLCLLLVGFGMKAGLFPLHFWLPGAHASAPGHVSALMSGVLVKMGFYGLLRTFSLVSHPPLWWAGLLLGLGSVTALFGVVASLWQSDIKRLLAYSTIENAGLITVGAGIFLFGRAVENPTLTALGGGGALFHLLNHSVFKSLLFFGAGAVMHATKERSMDRMGGLVRTLPVVGACFLAGVWALVGLPGANGFVGEVPLYLGALELGLGKSPWAAVVGTLAIVSLCLAGGLALISFLRAYAVMFLGRPRSTGDHHAGRFPFLHGALVFNTGLILLVGFVPVLLVPALDAAVRALAGTSGSAAALPSLGTLVSFGEISRFLVVVGPLALASIVAVRRLSARAPRAGTWDCGYVDSSPARMQYTASSFVGPSAQLLRRFPLRRERTGTSTTDVFPQPAAVQFEAREPLLDRVLVPFWQNLSNRFYRLRVLHHGVVQFYLLYILLALLLTTVWAMARIEGLR